MYVCISFTLCSFNGLWVKCGCFGTKKKQFIDEIKRKNNTFPSIQGLVCKLLAQFHFWMNQIYSFITIFSILRKNKGQTRSYFIFGRTWARTHNYVFYIQDTCVFLFLFKILKFITVIYVRSVLFQFPNQLFSFIVNQKEY